jgi:RNase P subunit RPR2
VAGILARRFATELWQVSHETAVQLGEMIKRLLAATRVSVPRPPARAPCREGRMACRLDQKAVRQYLTSMKTAISTKGQIVLPAEFRRQDEITAGQEFRIERVERGEYRLVRIEPPANEGLVDWLLACPEKDFFVPIESESTATL